MVILINISVPMNVLHFFKGLKILSYPSLRKPVLENEANATIECKINISTMVNVTWIFRHDILTNFIGGSEECNSQGILQGRRNPRVLVICHLNYTLHMGNYMCYAQNQTTLYLMTTLLNVLGRFK